MFATGPCSGTKMGKGVLIKPTALTALLLAVLAMPAGAAVESQRLAAVGGEAPEAGVESRRFDPLVLRIQEGLTESGNYKGPLDGIMGPETEAAIRAYQRQSGFEIDGRATEELAVNLETSSRVGLLLQRLEEARRQDIESARNALLSRPETRHLVTDIGAEVSDPTRDPSSCFGRPTSRCLLEEAAESSKAIFKPEMRNWALGEILAAQAKAGMTPEAMVTVRRIGDPRLIMVALRDIAEALAKAGRTEEAHAATDIIPDSVKKAEALAAIASIQSRRGDHQDASRSVRRLLETIAGIEAPAKVIAFQARAATILAQAGHDDAANASLEEAGSLARALTDPDDRGASLRHVAAAMAEMGRPGEALELLTEVEGEINRTPVLAAAAAALAEAGDANRALATADNIEALRYKTVVLSRIAVAQAKAGENAAAKATVALAAAVIEGIEFPYARDYATSRVALALAEIGKAAEGNAFAEAVDAALDIADDQLRAHVLWVIAAERRRAGDASGSSLTETLARRATGAIRSSVSRVWMYGDIASNHIAANEMEAAWQAFRNGLDEAADVQNAWARARVLSRMATTLTELTAAEAVDRLPRQ